jgi:hypothetical protein
VRQRADALRNSSGKILRTILEAPSPPDECEKPCRLGLEGQLRDVLESLEDIDRTLNELGSYLFA